MQKKIFLIVSIIVLTKCISFAQNISPITVETKNSILALTAGEDEKLYQTYFGEKLNNTTDYLKIQSGQHELYSTYGNENLYEPAIRITHSDGNPSLNLRYMKHQIEKPEENISIVHIYLKDPEYPVNVTLNFKTYFNENIIEQWTEITHNEDSAVTLYNFASSQLNFDANNYWLSQFHGDWAREMQMQESELTSGIKIIDSKLGARADFYQTPVFFLSLNGKSDENNGELIAGTLEWTGNFQFMFEIDAKNSLRIITGINPFQPVYPVTYEFICFCQ